jgi:DNA-binding Lrp family transcriptional regulator
MDAELLKNNCLHYSKSHPKAVDILKMADGKKNYKNIAKDLDLHETTVSSCLKEAERLGLAQKHGRIYKKSPGILRYMSQANTEAVKKTENISKLIAKSDRRNPKLLEPKYRIAFGVNFGNKAEKMAKAYLWLYITENILRQLIRKAFENEQDWWNKKVNRKIKEDVKDAIRKYPYYGFARRDELEYTHLGQLKEIIAAKNNWDMFLPFLEESNKTSFQLTIDKAISSRNSIAHCTSLTDEDFKFVEIRFKDILTMIKSS